MESVEIEGSYYRLIPSRFPPVAVYEGLVANDRWDRLAEVETKTNPRLMSEARLLAAYPDTPPDKVQNWNLAPFKYINPEGSRFFDPIRPALELADNPQTALAVSVAKRQNFLSRTSEPPIGLDMRMLMTPVRGTFVDLRHLPIDMSHQDRWRLGAEVSSAADGVLFRPPERPSATAMAVIRGDALGRTIQTVHYRFVWNGNRISMLYAFNDEGTKIFPETLGQADDALAA